MEKQSTIIEDILSKDNLNRAYQQVIKNKGAAGVDGMECEGLLSHLRANGTQLRESVRNQSYKPMPVKRVEIPKEDGSKRKLGIPTVKDRMIQQAISQVLGPIYERKFHANSYGFRPGKSAQQAVLKAVEYMNEGYNWVVDLDLEKFFDTVNHDKLISILNKEIKDGKVLSLIRKFLVSGVMVGEQMEETEIGTPQGGNLSPLLANIILNELDWELEKRKLKFVRYADDCIILVRSQKAANRVMESITRYIESKLILKVNRKKSKIGRPTEIKYLGFTFYNQFKEKKYKAKAHEKSIQKVVKRLKLLTSRKWSVNNAYKAQKISEVLRGWINYFKIGSILTVTRKLDRILRYRFRMCIWKHWKTPQNRAKNLIKLGVYKKLAYSTAYNGARIAHCCQGGAMNVAVTKERLTRFGLISMLDYYTERCVTC